MPRIPFPRLLTKQRFPTSVCLSVLLYYTNYKISGMCVYVYLPVYTHVNVVSRWILCMTSTSPQTEILSSPV